MHIAIEGCSHGELDQIYSCISQIEKKQKLKVDLLLLCGDFQANRNCLELALMKCPEKHRKMGSFYKYYTGEKVAPIMTIVIGGNHESNLHLHELNHGGWLATKIYYLGYAGVVNFNGLRIAGLSGIYKYSDYNRGHFERPPFTTKGEMISVYHTREIDTLRLTQLTNKIHIVMSHDWPSRIYHYGNLKKLLKQKPFFAEDIRKNRLGSEANAMILKELKPRYFFSAHLHSKFPAIVQHGDRTQTKFLALGKCLPNTEFLQILDFPELKKETELLHYDAEWLAILQNTNNLMPLSLDGLSNQTRADFIRKKFSATKIQIDRIKEVFEELEIPNNFSITSAAFMTWDQKPENFALEYKQNPQTKELFQKLGLKDLFNEAQEKIKAPVDVSDSNEIDLLMEDEN